MSTDSTTSLTNGTLYAFAVRSVGGSNMDTVNGPAASVVARPLDFPDAPTGLAAVAGSAQATLTWTITSDTSVTGYQVSSDGGTTFAVIPDSDATTIEYTVTGLTNGTAYTFTLRAVNINGNSPSSDTATPTPEAAPPAAPTGLRAHEGMARCC